jgi:DNA-binding NtrC family response regulator
LYYRLKVYELRVPPLRCRGATDLRRLVEAILNHLGARRHRPPATLGPAAWEVFARYPWPGNVRELENTLERMIVAAGDDLSLTPAHMPEDLTSSTPARDPISRTMPSLGEALATLERNGFNRGHAASELGVSRHQLYRLLRRHAVPSPTAGVAVSCGGCDPGPDIPVFVGRRL